MPDVNWTETRLQKALSDLDIYFRNAKDMDKAFLTFCDRVVWAGVCASVFGSSASAIWNCLVHQNGLFSNKDFEVSPQRIASLKRKNPFYVTGLPVLVKAYLKYMYRPNAAIAAELKEELEAMGFGEHMDLFYEAVKGGVELVDTLIR
jgi:hypothetical protein